MKRNCCCKKLEPPTRVFVRPDRPEMVTPVVAVTETAREYPGQSIRTDVELARPPDTQRVHAMHNVWLL